MYNICSQVQTDNAKSNISYGIKLKFKSELFTNGENEILPAFDFSEVITGFDLTVQNGLINTFTTEGTDTAFPDRGTTFREEAMNGYIISQSDMQHAANFASISVKDFLNNNLESQFNLKPKALTKTFSTYTVDTMDSEALLSPTLRKYQLTPSKVGFDKIDLEAYFEATDGQSSGIDLSASISS